MQILDPQEEAFPFDGRTIFESIGGTLRHETLKAGDLRDRYLDRLAARKDELDLAGPRNRLAIPSASHQPPRRLGAAVALRRIGAGTLMWTIGPIGFTAPVLLAGPDPASDPVAFAARRAARADPAAISRAWHFLLGLTDDETQTDRTPWWLLLLRMVAIAAAIIGFAGPILNPKTETPGDGPHLDRDGRHLGGCGRTGRGGSTGFRRC